MEHEPHRLQHLHQRWLHSHEEDTPTEQVFRPAGFAFPRSRGRVGFDLRPDGSYLDLGIAPADGRLEVEGTWRLEDDVLTLSCHLYPGGQNRLRVVEWNADRLVVEK